MSILKIAPNHNNSAGLKPFETLSPPLFARYKGAAENILTEWRDAVEQEFDGDQNYVDIGLKSVRWILFRLSRAEFAYLKANFSGSVTIYTLDQGGNAYHVYNATLKPIRAGLTEATWSADAIGGWSDVTLEFYNLESL